MNETTQSDQRKKIVAAAIPAVILAVIAAVGWYLYLSTQQESEALTADLLEQVGDFEVRVLQLVQQRDGLQTSLDEERQTRAQIQDSLASQRDSLAELKSTLAAEQASAAGLQADLESARDERMQLERDLQQEVERLATNSSELEQSLAQHQAQQQSLQGQIDAAATEKQQLSAQLEEAQDRRQALQDQIAQVNAEVAAKESALAAARDNIAALNDQLAQTREEKSLLEARVADLSEQQKKEAAHFALLQSRLEQELDEHRVEITQLKNRMTVINLTSEVLFNSGSAAIKPEGRKVLDLIAASLNAYPDREISIEGHTDNVPVGKASRYVSNWDLSMTRALAAVDHLQRNASVSPGRLRAVGHGEYKPVASNETTDGRQLNRRIEIRLLPELDETS